MSKRAQLAELSPRPGASPGLMRRRYSVPETIMRKYRLAQQRAEAEEGTRTASPVAGSAPAAGGSGTCGCGAGEPAAAARRDRELMRRSALLRRLYGRAPACACCREARSLDASRCELRAPGWATPKRLRLHPPHHDVHGRSTAEDFTDSTFRSHRFGPSYNDNSAPDGGSDDRIHRDVFSKYCEMSSSDATGRLNSQQQEDIPIESRESAFQVLTDERSFSDASDAFTTSISTAKETDRAPGSDCEPHTNTSSDRLDGRVSERTASADNYDSNVLPYDRPITIDTPSYEVLEIVVSETLNADSTPAIRNLSADRSSLRSVGPIVNYKTMQNVDIDEYVSNILVESLNSLTDQLEHMNASIGSDRKISIMEKEIKVKLQNTGVNTIVHLSPTSNNQIIFGNEELMYKREEPRDMCNNLHEEPSLACDNNNDISRDIRLEDTSTNGNVSANDPFTNLQQHDNVNQAVLHQIQKLFNDELNTVGPVLNYSSSSIPGISHIEISNVDVFIDNEDETYRGGSDTIEMCTQRLTPETVIGGVGAGNYYRGGDGSTVPRFSAMPHTDSMEVNTSSSEDAEVFGSDCTSLVDSLDDPNSPRSLLLRRSYEARRSELVRSAIDVLDLLPENVSGRSNDHPKEKGEAFFIRIKGDDECDCEKENIIVADHMPERIKQKLHRRHRKRELRMECARRGRVKHMKRELTEQRREQRREQRSNNEAERECLAIVNAIIDDVVAKILQDEYKYMKIKQKPKMITSKSEECISERNYKKDLNSPNGRDSNRSGNYFSKSRHEDEDRRNNERRRSRNKLSLRSYQQIPPEERPPKRIYQKSEIHDGSKRIEILEILEYADSSQTSPETTNSDENQNYQRHRKSRIPIPINERIPRVPGFRGGSCSPTSSLLQVLATPASPFTPPPAPPRPDKPPALTRRASVPTQESRSRSNSLRFKRVFDIIPEEKPIIAIESSNEDLNHNRRVSAPELSGEFNTSDSKVEISSSSVDSVNIREISELRRREMKHASTSPLSEERSPQKLRSRSTMTSPRHKSAATSPAPGTARCLPCH